MKYELINKEWLEKADELISQMTPENKAYLVIQAKKVEAIDKKLKASLLKDNILKFELPTGKVTIVNTPAHNDIEPEIVRDMDKVVEYATKNNLEIPMIHQIDVEKLKALEWYQKNISLFEKQVDKVVSKRATQRIIVK